MFTVSEDRSAALVVHYFSDATNSDADYEAYCKSIAQLNTEAPFDLLRLGILAFDSSNPMPNAMWRKRIAEASANIHPNTMFILVSERQVVRGIMTAMNWVRPPTFQWSIVENLDKALDEVAGLRPDAVSSLRRLHEDCRRQAQSIRPRAQV